MRALRKAFPNTPIVADLKTMDGGYLEAEMMAKAGATHVVVMARAHAETVKCVVKAGKDFGCKVMGDNMICEDMVAGAKWLEDLGCDYIIHHIGYDERRGIAASGKRMPSPLDQLREVVQAVKIPVQAVGGLMRRRLSEKGAIARVRGQLADMAHEFTSQTPIKRFLIVAAGPVANLVLAVLLYTGLSWC